LVPVNFIEYFALLSFLRAGASEQETTAGSAVVVKSLAGSILVEKPGRSRPVWQAEALDVHGPAGNL
jgi:hypothetical protein